MLTRMPARCVATLAGRRSYVDSDWTEPEWRLIEQVMARCTNPGPRAPTARKPKRRGKGRPIATKPYRQLRIEDLDPERRARLFPDR